MSLDAAFGFQSQTTKALAAIDSTKYPDTNKDFQANLIRLNQFVDYIASYLQTMQKGIDKNNQDPIAQIQGVASDLVVLLGGGELLYGIDLGDLQYFLPAIGALLGFDTTTPFPINLFNAAEHFLLGYVVPLDSFATVIEGIIDGWAVALGIDQSWIDAINELLDAFGGLYTSASDLLTSVESLFNIIGTDFPFISNIWHGITTLLGGFSLSELGGLVDPAFKTVAPWIETLAEAVEWLNQIIESFAGGVTNLQGILNFASLFNSINFLPAGGFHPIPALTSWIQNALKPTNLLAMLSVDPTGGSSLGLTGVIPLENIAVDAIGAIIGGAQSVIDAILTTVGFTAGSGTSTDVTHYFTDLLSMLGNPNLTNAAFSAVTSVTNFINNMLAPTNLLPIMNPVTKLISSLNIPGLDASKITTGQFAQSMVNITSIAASIVTGVLGAAQIPGLDASKIISGVFTVASIPALPATIITSGVFGAGQIPGLDATKIVSGILATAQIPTITAAMTTGVAYTDTIVNAITGGSSTGNAQSAITTALQNIPYPNVLGLLGSADVGSALQSHVDAGVQAITGGASTGNSLANFQNSLSALTNLLGYTTSGAAPASSVAGITNTNNQFIGNTAVNNQLQHGIDPTVNGPFDLSQLMTNSTLPTVAITAAASLICFDQTPNGGVKQSIRWCGYPTGGTMANITGFYVNVYKLNTTTGVSTLVYGSPNIAGSVGTGSVPVWNALNLSSGNFITTTQGNIYAVEIVIVGMGTYNVVGVINYLPAHPTAIPAKYGATRNNPSPLFGSAGPGVGNNTATITETRAIATTDNALLVWTEATTANTLASITRTVTCGGVPMVSLGAALNYGASSPFQWGEVWGLLSPPTGPSVNIVSTLTGAGAVTYSSLCSTSYSGVGSFGPVSSFVPGSATGALSQTVTNAFTGQLVAQGFLVGTSTGWTISAYNQTQRFIHTPSTATYPLLVVGDAPGAASITFTASTSYACLWNAFAVPLIPPTLAPPTLNNPASGNPVAYTNSTPWIGLAGTAGQTTYSPVLVPITASGSFDPTAYPWANYFDVVVCSGGGGGAAGGNAQGSVGGSHGAWGQATYTKAQVGSALIPFVIGGGGAGGVGTSAPGSAGSTSSASVTGQTALSVAGGAGAPATATGTNTAGAGATMPGLTWNDHYSNSHTVPGGAGGGSGQQPGGQPGGGGAGGNAVFTYGTYIYGGAGGAGIGYVYVYQ